MTAEPQVIGYVEDHTAGIPPISDEQLAADPGAGMELAQPAAPEEGWLEESVREHLSIFGSGLHMLFGGESEKAFEMSQKDLQRIAPPLTRILNHHESLAAFGVISDPLLLAEGTVLYAGRSVLQVRAARQKLEEEREGDLEQLDVDVEPVENGNVTAMRTRRASSPRAQRIVAENEQVKQREEEESHE